MIFFKMADTNMATNFQKEAIEYEININFEISDPENPHIRSFRPIAPIFLKNSDKQHFYT